VRRRAPGRVPPEQAARRRAARNDAGSSGGSATAGRILRARPLWIALALLPLAVWWLWPARRAANLILISVDTLRADRLGCYGYSRNQTPHFDRWAAEGFLFTHAFSEYPLTLPAHVTLLTGQLPLHHGVRENAGYKLDEDETTLAEVLKSSGYRTAAFIGAYVLASEFGVSQGFDTFDQAFATSIETVGASAELQRPAPAVTSAFLRWLADHEDRPFFAFVHFFDVHLPRPGGYDAAVSRVDESLGEIDAFLRRSGLLETTAIERGGASGSGVRPARTGEVGRGGARGGESGAPRPAAGASLIRRASGSFDSGGLADDPGERSPNRAFVEDKHVFGEGIAQLGRGSAVGDSVRREDGAARFLRGEESDGLARCFQNLSPPLRQLCRVRRLAVEVEPSELGLGVADRTARQLQDGPRAEARVLSACGPGQIPERLEGAITGQGVDEVPGFDPPDEGQDLARGEIEGMQSEPEVLVLHEGEEPVGAVLGPLDDHDVLSAPYFGLHERRPLAKDGKRIASLLERAAVGLPGGGQGLFGVVEQVDVAGTARRIEELVQRRRSGDVALAAANPILG
jgi:hypothetical protein